MSTPDITSVEMTRSFSWMRLISQCVIALLLFIAANVFTYETSGFFRTMPRSTSGMVVLRHGRDVLPDVGWVSYDHNARGKVLCSV